MYTKYHVQIMLLFVYTNTTEFFFISSRVFDWLRTTCDLFF